MGWVARVRSRLSDGGDVDHVGLAIESAGDVDGLAEKFRGLALIVDVVPDVGLIVAKDVADAVLRDDFAGEVLSFRAGRGETRLERVRCGCGVHGGDADGARSEERNCRDERGRCEHSFVLHGCLVA